MRAGVIGASLCAALLLGCLGGGEGPAADGGASDGGVDAQAAADGVVEIGKGEVDFEPLADDETLPYVAGGQGGYHVFVGFRIRDLDPMRILLEVTTRVVGHPDLELTRSGRLTFEPEDATDAGQTAADAGQADAADADEPARWYRYIGWPAQILGASEHEGDAVELEVLLEDRAGLRAHARKTIVIGTLER